MSIPMNKMVDIDTAIAQKQQQEQQPVEHEPVEQEAVEQEAAPETPEQEEQKQPEQEPESFQARNFKELRSITERIKQEKEQLAKENAQLRKYYEQLQSQANQPRHEAPAQSQSSEEWDLSDEDVVEGKHAKKIYQTAKQALEEQRRVQQQLEVMRIEREIEKEMPDYYQVVTPESVSAFRDLDPEMAEIIGSYPDLKKQAKAAYKAIVSRGLHKMADYEPAKQLLKSNKQKPPASPTHAGGGGTDTPLSRAMDYYAGDQTEQMKKMWYEQMKKAQLGR